MSLVLKEVYNKANTIHDDTSIIKSRECCYSNKRNIGYPIKIDQNEDTDFLLPSFGEVGGGQTNVKYRITSLLWQK